MIELLLADVPFEPDAPDARRLVLDELAKPEYQQAKPGLFDQLVQGFLDWLQSLQAPGGPGAGSAALVVVGIVLLAVGVVAVLVFGLPRLRSRSRLRGGALFGDDDIRSADELRASSARAAAAGDLETAVVERFRAIARALAERTVVTVSPGTTARSFATHAADVFPERAAQLDSAAGDFDAVRYLDRPATLEQYERMRELDEALAGARPRLAPVPA